MSPLKHLTGIAVVAVVIAVVLVGWGNVPVAAQGQRTPTRWEYAYFNVKNGKLTLIQSTQEVVVEPPLGSAPASETPGGRDLSRYTTSSRQVGNHEIAALNLFGSGGWEVVSVSQSGGETRMLMKRPY